MHRGFVGRPVAPDAAGGFGGGIGLGLAIALGLMRVMSKLLFGVNATDPLTFLATAILICPVRR